MQDHIELVDGRWPDAAPAATPDDPPVIDVAMGTEAAASGGFTLGETRDIHASWRDDALPIQIRVVGLTRPIDYTERYWGVRRDHFHVPVEKTDAFAFFAPKATLLDAMAGYMPELRARLEVYAQVERSAFVADEAGLAAVRFRAAFESIAKEIDRARVETEIVRVLNDYETKEFFSSIPLLVLTLQIVGIVLFYLVLVSTMVVERQSAEVALLKSRGAGIGHIMSISTLEGLLLVALALGVGPLVAREAIAFLGYSPAFEGLTGGRAPLRRADRRGLHLERQSERRSAIFALLWPAWRSNRATVVHYARSTSRPEDKPAFQRYYLDLVVVGVGALLFFPAPGVRLARHRGPLRRTATGPALAHRSGRIRRHRRRTVPQALPANSVILWRHCPSPGRRVAADGHLASDPRSCPTWPAGAAADHGNLTGHVRRHVRRDAG